MSEEVILAIGTDGVVHTLYTDKVDLRAIGELHINRASNIEFDNARNGWIVEFTNGTFLSHAGGDAYQTTDTLKATVYLSREDANRDEVSYLQAHMAEGAACSLPEARA